MLSKWMNRSLKFSKAALGLVAIVMLVILVISLIPPWRGKPFYMLHIYTGIPYHFQRGWPPRYFSGVWRDYGVGKSYNELSYKDGRRDGPQHYYDKTGHLVLSCEFKDGLPCSGPCDFWEFRPWRAEYRNGKVWTGAMQEFDSNSPSYYSMKYYFKGKLCDETEFRHLMGFGTNGALIGIDYLTWTPQTQSLRN